MTDKTQPTAHAEITTPISADLRGIDDAGAKSAPITLMTEDRACTWAWDQVQQDVGAKGWTAGDYCNFHGFFLWGWNYRGQYEAQRPAAPPAPAAVAVSATAEMVRAYLQAHDDYWRESDAEPRAKPVWRNGMDFEATRIGIDAALAAAPAQAAYSREEWIAQAAQVFVDDGDDQKAAQDLARWHWNQQDWTSGEIDDPREVAREDLAGREKPTAPAQAVAVPDGFGTAEHWKEKAQYWADVAHRLRGEALRGEPVDGIVHPAQAVAVPAMPPTDDRRPYYEDQPEGYLESDDEWIGRNLEAVRWLSDNHAAVRAALTPAQEHATQLAGQHLPADEFRSDTDSLVRNIVALLDLDAQGCLVPHGVGGHARGLLSAAASRLAASDQAQGCTRSHPHENMSPMCGLRTEIARLNHAAAIAQATAAPAQAQEDALEHAELQEIQRAVEQFTDCGETDVDYALLMRAAQAGYLECTHFQVMNESALNLDAARAAQGGA